MTNMVVIQPGSRTDSFRVFITGTGWKCINHPYESMEDLERVFQHKRMGYAYTRIGNPTITALESICIQVRLKRKLRVYMTIQSG